MPISNAPAIACPSGAFAQAVAVPWPPRYAMLPMKSPVGGGHAERRRHRDPREVLRENRERDREADHQRALASGREPAEMRTEPERGEEDEQQRIARRGGELHVQPAARPQAREHEREREAGGDRGAECYRARSRAARGSCACRARSSRARQAGSRPPTVRVSFVVLASRADATAAAGIAFEREKRCHTA